MIMGVFMEEAIENSANKFICKFLIFADKFQLCETDEFMTVIIREVPQELLIKAVIASFGDDILQGLAVNYGSKVVDLDSFEQMKKELCTDIQKILHTYCLSDVYDSQSAVECVDIIGYQQQGEGLIPLFVPLVLANILYTIRNEKDFVRKKELFIEKLCAANYNKITSGLELGKKNMNQNDIEIWIKEARAFVEDKLGTEYAVKRKMRENIDVLAKRLDYLKGDT